MYACDEKISVIVPIYNASNYLKCCVDSILKQTYSNLEVILVNDGSTDSSPEIIKMYAESDKRVIVVFQDNQGLSCARNAGLDVATGQYISFVDADDYIHPEMIEILYKAIKNDNAEISCCGTNIVDADDTVKKSCCGINSILNNVQAAKSILNNDIVTCSVCDKLFDSMCFNGSEIRRFVPKIMFEDLELMPRVLAGIHKVSCRQEALYYYRLSPASLTRSRFSSRKYSCIDAEYLRYRCYKENFPNLVPLAANEYFKTFFKIMYEARFEYKDPIHKKYDCLTKEVYDETKTQISHSIKVLYIIYCCCPAIAYILITLYKSKLLRILKREV